MRRDRAGLRVHADHEALWGWILEAHGHTEFGKFCLRKDAWGMGGSKTQPDPEDHEDTEEHAEPIYS